MMNTVNSEFTFVEIWFTDQVSKAFEIEGNINLTLIISYWVDIIKIKHSREPKFRKFGNGLLIILYCFEHIM